MGEVRNGGVLRRVAMGGAALVTLLVGAAVPIGAALAATSSRFTWTRAATGPAASAGASLAYDTAAGEFILFDGTATPTTPSRGATWAFHAGAWTLLHPTAAPSPRTTAAMAYDAKTGDIVLFGGKASNAASTQTWVWNGTTWARVHPATIPTARYAAAMVYDSAMGDVLLFGGTNNATTFADTWVWTGTNWKKEATPTAPSARTGAAMAYDASDSTVVLFGGDAKTNQTWVWSGTAWSAATPATLPAGRWEASAAYLASSGGVILFGGTTSSHSLSTTWAWNGTTWSPVTPTTSPPARVQAAIASDPAGTVLLFGGTEGTTSADSWTGSILAIGPPGKSGTPVAVTGTMQASVSWSAPLTDGGSPVTKYGVRSTPAGGTCTVPPTTTSCVVGGLTDGTTYTFTVIATNANGPGSASTKSNPVSPTVTTLTSLSPTSGVTTGGTAETVHGTHFMTGSTVLVSAVDFGNAPATALSVTSATTLTLVTPVHAPGKVTVFAITSVGTAEKPTAFTYTVPVPTVSSLSVGSGGVTGGTSVTLTGSHFTTAGTGTADLTAVSFGGYRAPFTVTATTTAVAIAPPHDSGLVTVGATSAGGTGTLPTSFTFVARGATVSATTFTWTATAASTHPTARHGAAMAYDPRTSQLVLFGGVTSSGADAQTWLFDSAGWTESAVTTPAPSARSGASMAYDPFNGDVVLFGGRNAAGAVLSDTWLWTGSAWIKASPASSPGARADASIAFDPATAQIVLFGGVGATGTALGDTWVYAGTTWTPPSPATSPSPRSGAAVAFDQTSGTVVLFGGANGTTVDAETWEWNGTTWQKATPATSPVAQSGASAFFDPTSGTVILFTATSAGGSWSWNGVSWHHLTPHQSAPARASSVAAWDPATLRAVLFGGLAVPSGTELGDTSTWAPRVPSVPTPPTSVHATPGNASATITWTAPTTDGGSTISGYTATATPGGATCSTGGTTSCVISTLTNGNSYTFTVRATNTKGTGIASVPSSPIVPSAVTVLKVAPAAGPTAGGTSVTVTGARFLTGSTPEVSAIDFGATPGTALNISTSTSLTVTSPAHTPGTFGIVAVTPGGTTTLPTAFTFTAPVPTVGSLTVSSGPSVGGTAVGVAGTGFTTPGTGAPDVDRVTFGHESATTVNVASSTALSVVTPPVPVGLASVTVTTTGGTVVDPTAFTFTGAAAPTPTSLVWTEVTPTTHPVALATASAVYDASSSSIIVFGGFNPVLGDASATWEWNGSNWNKSTPATSPPARRDPSMAYDPMDRLVVLFGGTATGTVLSTTWTWDGSTWTKQNPAAAPTARRGAAMAYDPAIGEVVLFGGLDSSDVSLGDTWTWNGSAWTRLAAAGTPVPRTDAAMLFSPSTGGLSMFGGSDTGVDVGSQAIFDGSSWTTKAIVGPGARVAPVGASNGILFGGGITGNPSTQTWDWNGATWAQLHPASPPPARQGAAGAFDNATGQLVVFGGAGSSNILGDTWVLAPAATSPPPAPGAPKAFAGDDEALVTWTAPPGSVTGYAVVSTPGTQTCTTTSLTSCEVTGLVNGTSYSFKVRADNLHGAGRFSAASTPVVPAALVLSGVAPATGPTTGGTAVVLSGRQFAASVGAVDFGPSAATTVVVVSTSTVDAVTPTSVPGAVTVTIHAGSASATRPSAFTFTTPAPTISGLTVDVGPTTGGTATTIQGTHFTTAGTGVADVADVIFGGEVATTLNVHSSGSLSVETPTGPPGTATVTVTTTGGSATSKTAFTFVAGAVETPATLVWSQAKPARAPAGRSGAAMTYDVAQGDVVLFGGAVAGGGPSAETWLWNGTTWTQITPAASPPALSGASMAYDPATRDVVLFGGTGTGSILTNATWLWNGTTWTSTSPSRSPAKRTDAAMAYDPASGDLMLVGGRGTHGDFGDTWGWNGSTWQSFTPATSPPARSLGSLAFDPMTGSLVLFGGQSTVASFGTTWVWHGVNWVKASTSGPSARSGASMAYDAHAESIVLFGGDTATGNPTATTWTWSGTWHKDAPATSPSARSGSSTAYDLSSGSPILFGGTSGSSLDADTWLLLASPTAPGAPGTPSVTSGNASAKVTWSAPASSGSSTIVTYTATAVPGGAHCTSATLGCTLVGLANGTSYTVSVAASNSTLTGSSSPSSAPFVPSTVPGPPQTVLATSRDTAAMVAWKVPSTDGGSAITGYTVSSTPPGHGCSTTGSLGCTVSGLTVGGGYSFIVRAKNIDGSGAPSTPSNRVTATTGPSAPGAPAATAGPGTASLTWSAPATDGGSPIVGYAVASTPPGAGCSTSGALVCTATGLAAGVPYTFSVSASNASGTGPASTASNVVVSTDPTIAKVSPSNVSSAGGTSITITGSQFTTGTTGKSAVLGVTVGTVAATGIVVSSSTQLTAVTPAVAAGPVTVTVTTTASSASLIDGITAATPKPTVSAVTPGSAPATSPTLVHLSGTFFTTPGSTASVVEGVTFGTMPASGITVISATSLTAITPEHVAARVPVSVVTSGGTGVAPGTFSFTVPGPTLTSLTPNAGSTTGGAVVKVTGGHFETAVSGADVVTSVTLGTTAVSNLTVSSVTSLSFVAPAHPAGLAALTVKSSGGKSTLLTCFDYFSTSVTMTSVSPASGSSTGGTSVTIDGTHFKTATSGASDIHAVDFGGVPATFTVTSATSLKATTPAHAPGIVNVTINATATLTSAFTFTSSPPTISTVHPSMGLTTGGTQIAVTGTHFMTAGASDVTAVLFGTAASSAINVTSANALVATDPIHAPGTVGVSVNATAGDVTAPSVFTYVVPAPVIGTVSPPTGLTTGGTSVTITGTGFETVSTGRALVTNVTFGSTSATQLTLHSAKTLVAMTPTHAPGPVTVTVVAGAITSVDKTGFTFVPPPPTLTSLIPATSGTGGGTTVTLRGSFFETHGARIVTAVNFATSAATTVNVKSPTVLTVLTPAHSLGVVGVTVVSTGGQVTLPNSFTFVVKPPVVTSLSPSIGLLGGGTTVTVSGTGLSSPTSVTFGTAPGRTLHAVSSTALTVVAPGHAPGQVGVTVTTGSGSSTPVAFTYVTVPLAPSAPTLTTALHTVTVHWIVPSNQGAPMTGFRIGMTVNGVKRSAIVLTAGGVGAAPTPGFSDVHTISGVNGGSIVTVTVEAVNGAGTGPPSPTSLPISVVATPEKPQGVVATAGDGEATVAWRVPTDQGGVITSFLLTSKPKAVAVTVKAKAPKVGAALETTVRRLHNGVLYTFSVIAVNRVGKGPAGSSLGVVPHSGFWEVGANGAVFPYGNARSYGSMAGHALNRPVVGMAAAIDNKGYWLVASDGGLFAFGDARFHGSMGGRPLNAPIIGMIASPTGHGYLEVASDGGIFAFGKATFHGSLGGHSISSPIVDVTITPGEHGYWMLAADGALYGFGNAAVQGTDIGKLISTAVGVASTHDGAGYWIVTSKGRVNGFGDASKGYGDPLLVATSSLVGITASINGAGYWIGGSNGRVFGYGDAETFHAAARHLAAPIVTLSAMH